MTDEQINEALSVVVRFAVHYRLNDQRPLMFVEKWTDAIVEEEEMRPGCTE